MNGCSRLLAVGMLAMLTGGMASAEERLQDVLPGRWRLDPVASQSLGDTSTRVVQAYQASRLDLLVEFKKNGTLITTVVSPSGPSATESKWKLARVNGRALTLENTDPATKTVSICEVEFRSSDAFKMTVKLRDTPGTAPSMIYQRVK